MFDPGKISTFIQIITEALEKKTEYRVACDLSESELVELSKHFDAKFEYLLQGRSIVTFTKKKSDA